MEPIMVLLMVLVLLGVVLDTFYIINSPKEIERKVVYCHEQWPKGVHSWSYNYADKLECYRCGYKPDNGGEGG